MVKSQVVLFAGKMGSDVQVAQSVIHICPGRVCPSYGSYGSKEKDYGTGGLRMEKTFKKGLL